MGLRLAVYVRPATFPRKQSAPPDWPSGEARVDLRFADGARSDRCDDDSHRERHNNLTIGNVKQALPRFVVAHLRNTTK